MARLIIVPHGRTAWNREQRFRGQRFTVETLNDTCHWNPEEPRRGEHE